MSLLLSALAACTLAQCDPSNDICVRMEGVGSIGTPTIEPSQNGYEISITATGSPLIYVEGKNDVDIFRITINTSSSTYEPELWVRRWPAYPQGIRHVVNIGPGSSSSGHIILRQVQISGDLGSAPNQVRFGLVKAQAIESIAVGGSIYANIETTPHPSRLSQITSVQAQRSILGNVVTNYGRISVLTAINSTNVGGIGIDTDGTVYPTEVTARDFIAGVAAYRINASILANGTGSGQGRVLGVQTFSGGAFAGSITARTVTSTFPDPGIDISGPINGTITVQGDVSKPIEGSLLAASGSITIGGNIDGNTQISIPGAVNGPIRIGGSLQSGSSIALGSIASTGSVVIGDNLAGTVTISQSQGLAGQIVVNRDNTSPASTWSGNVSVNGVSLTARPYYSVESSALGGGAVGLAPFRLYESDCSPQNNGFAGLSLFEPSATGVFARYYGPIRASTVAEEPEAELPIVEMRDPYDVNKWGDCGVMFQVILNPPGAASSRSLRIRYIGTPNDVGLGWYRVRLRPRGIICNDVAQIPDPVGNYYFGIGIDCNGSGGIDAGDFLAGSWDPQVDCNRNGVSDVCELLLDGDRVDEGPNGVPNGVIDACELPGSCPCNFNSDSSLNSQDFFDFLTCFFGGSCPTGRCSDYNEDGATNSQDFFDFLSCFFSGC